MENNITQLKDKIQKTDIIGKMKGKIQKTDIIEKMINCICRLKMSFYISNIDKVVERLLNKFIRMLFVV